MLSYMEDAAGMLMDTVAERDVASEENDGALVLNEAAPVLLAVNCTSYWLGFAPAGAQRPESTWAVASLPPP